jgi:HupE / UreJ protein
VIWRAGPGISLAVILTIVLVGATLAAPPAAAHPEDELCTPGGDLDPALCRALSDIDKADAKPGFGPAAEADADDLAFDRTPVATFAHYMLKGFSHILPKGLDHVLFILLLGLSAYTARGLLLQVTAFTLAHSLALLAASLGWVDVVPRLVEPLIALTIAWTALENIVFKTARPWRPALVFGFGLIHGLGFAAVFGAAALPAGVLVPALGGFNIGVELGQLAVLGITLAALAGVKTGLGRLHRPGLYPWLTVWPISVLIGLTGLWWAVQRAFLTG